MKICVLCYENFKTNPIEEVKKLSKFLEKDYDDAFLSEVMEATKIDKMRELKSKNTGTKQGPRMYRKGTVGDWKTHFTVAESEWFDNVMRVRMGQSTMFNFKYEF